ncbi:AB hydrolase superfamily protein [Escovopsis weberi]|uniref:AB hydrolase superfamily protein n=1 Tax=Escovopsis weberi TaxID=150374 RepID=A0A0M9VSZ4_ESCWE|nr:AB hydrolase superfamily protein [Escovopsis weberi]
MAGKLDPAFEKLYNENVARTPARPIDLPRLRESYSRLYSYASAPGPDVGRIYDDIITIQAGDDNAPAPAPAASSSSSSSAEATTAVHLPVRVYEPDGPGPWPVHLDFHGGGWGLGDLDSEAHLCRHYCAKARVAVIDVAYRLVPETPFPAAITDSFAALRFVRANGAARFRVRTDSISVGGVSAGGCIALALAHLARDAGIPLRLVAAGTPVVDDLSRYPSAAHSPWPSMRENEFAPTLNWARLAWFDRLRRSSMPPPGAPKEMQMQPGNQIEEEEKEEKEEKDEGRGAAGWFANLLAAPSFKGLARTLIFTAGADPLRDEGERYAQVLVANGVDVRQRRFLGVPHPFVHMDRALPQARDFIDSTAREIRLAHWDP